ncbi:carboxylating nicotinate-nucleotide diphosphorylase [Chitinispirillales bacterium ANBcel5]|uniref:carboxylating nicotinate-nucleotide diphosphorylase n=1 Tax=Cellulosispirillum alkaliphilum TaxID=3039283 RepID=UPI002A4F5385|nr:carboxylating nicotinate-nucleotide diphosphorylase [Chitinispirillales bacterium ANBcel5]
MMEQFKEKLIQSAVKTALNEDLGDSGDVTSNAIFNDGDRGDALIKSKGSGILSGSYLIAPVFDACGGDVKVEMISQDGDILKPGTEICRLHGPVKQILAGERTILNFLQHLSGIATAVSSIVEKLSKTNTKLLDTRKTLPGLRFFEKQAVVDGGGFNHRFGLYDMILIKDTHIKKAGSVKEALVKAFRYREKYTELKIEIEVQSVEDFCIALDMKPNRIMLDNMSIDTMKYCVNKRNTEQKSVELEASGNISIDTAFAIAQTGVDYISCGSVTHSTAALDLHLIIL